MANFIISHERKSRTHLLTERGGYRCFLMRFVFRSQAHIDDNNGGFMVQAFPGGCVSHVFQRLHHQRSNHSFTVIVVAIMCMLVMCVMCGSLPKTQFVFLVSSFVHLSVVKLIDESQLLFRIYISYFQAIPYKAHSI